MPTNDFSVFDTSTNSVTLFSTSEYNNNNTRVSGFTANTKPVSSKLVNTALHQGSIGTFALAGVLNWLGKDASDTNYDGLAFTNALKSYLVTNVEDKNAALLVEPTNGGLLFVRSFDGGLFYGVSDSSTYTADGGSYCGTIISYQNQNQHKAWIRFNQDQVSVKWFGAKGIGTDDTDAITNAHATGKVIFYPAGIYYINTNIVLNGKGGMVGEGATSLPFNSVYIKPNCSLIVFTNTDTDTDGGVWVKNNNDEVTGTNNACIDAIRIEDISFTTSDSNSTPSYGIEISYTVFMKNVSVNRFGRSGIFFHHVTDSQKNHISGPYNSTLINVTSDNNKKHGFLVGNGANAITFVQIEGKNNGESGFHTENTNDECIRYNAAYIPSANPSAIAITGGDCSYNDKYGWNFAILSQSANLYPGYAEGNTIKQYCIGNGLTNTVIHIAKASEDDIVFAVSEPYSYAQLSSAVYLGDKLIRNGTNVKRYEFVSNPQKADVNYTSSTTFINAPSEIIYLSRSDSFDSSTFFNQNKKPNGTQQSHDTILLLSGFNHYAIGVGSGDHHLEVREDEVILPSLTYQKTDVGWDVPKIKRCYDGSIISSTSTKAGDINYNTNPGVGSIGAVALTNASDDNYLKDIAWGSLNGVTIVKSIDESILTTTTSVSGNLTGSFQSGSYGMSFLLSATLSVSGSITISYAELGGGNYYTILVPTYPTPSTSHIRFTPSISVNYLRVTFTNFIGSVTLSMKTLATFANFGSVGSLVTPFEASTLPPPTPDSYEYHNKAILVGGRGGGVFLAKAYASSITSNGSGYAGTKIRYGDGTHGWERADTRITPEMFGAKGDGSDDSDDSDAFNAIYAAFPEGCEIHLQGNAHYNVTLSFNSSPAKYTFIGYNTRVSQIVIHTSSNLTFVGLNITTATIGIYITGGKNLTFRDITVSGCSQSCVAIASGVYTGSTFSVNNVVFDRCTFDGSLISDTDRGAVEITQGNTFSASEGFMPNQILQSLSFNNCYILGPTNTSWTMILNSATATFCNTQIMVKNKGIWLKASYSTSGNAKILPMLLGSGTSIQGYTSDVSLTESRTLFECADTIPSTKEPYDVLGGTLFISGIFVSTHAVSPNITLRSSLIGYPFPVPSYPTPTP